MRDITGTEEMVTFNKSWSGGTVPTTSAVKEIWQLHRVGCLCLLEKEGEGGRRGKPEENRGKYKQLCTSGEELNITDLFLYL